MAAGTRMRPAIVSTRRPSTVGGRGLIDHPEYQSAGDRTGFGQPNADALCQAETYSVTPAD